MREDIAESSFPQKSNVKRCEGGWGRRDTRPPEGFWLLNRGCNVFYGRSGEECERAERIVWFFVVTLLTPLLLDTNPRAEIHFFQHLEIRKAEDVLTARCMFKHVTENGRLFCEIRT